MVPTFLLLIGSWGLLVPPGGGIEQWVGYQKWLDRMIHRNLVLQDQTLMRKKPPVELLSATREKDPEAEAKIWLNDGEALNLRGRDLCYADFSGSTFWNAGLRNARLEGAKLQGTKLQGASLEEADLHNANLQGAQLKGANLQQAQMKDVDLRGAQLQDANLSLAQLQHADLGKIELQNGNIQRTDLQGANLQEVQLQGADLRWAKLQGANLQAVQLQGVSLQWAQLQGADLGGDGIGEWECPADAAARRRSQVRGGLWNQVPGGGAFTHQSAEPALIACRMGRSVGINVLSVRRTVPETILRD